MWIRILNTSFQCEMDRATKRGRESHDELLMVIQTPLDDDAVLQVASSDCYGRSTGGVRAGVSAMGGRQ